MEKIAKTDEQWREELAPDQYAVLRQAATEPPFTGKYTHEKATGIYRCGGCGGGVFNSGTKFDSGAGWAGFTPPAGAWAVWGSAGRFRGMPPPPGGWAPR